jgi:hypothetical protein
MVATAAVSTGAGLLIVAASQHTPAAYLGLVVPSGLWFSKMPPEHDGHSVRRTLTFPFSRLYDRMGEDMQDWCDTRIRAASAKPQWIADAVEYYYSQVQGGLKNDKARADLGGWRDSIMHKVSIVEQVGQDITQAQLRAWLQKHHSTLNMRKYSGDDPPQLARRLETEALHELHLFLAYIYRLGHHRLLIYPFRPSAHRARPGVSSR